MDSLQKKEWLVIVNPNAGVGKGGRDWDEISKLLEKHEFEFEAVFTEKRNHAINLVQEKIREGYEKIIVVGGDGTMNEVVNGIFIQKHLPTTDIKLGMISVGTGNDWVRTFDVPVNYEEAIKVIKAEKTFIQDAGKIKYYSETIKMKRYFVNMAGLGFDAIVAQRTNADKDKGRKNPVLYLKNLILSLFSYKSLNANVTIDGKKLSDKIFSVGIGIGKFNGGGMQQAPGAIPNDGLLSLTLIKHMSLLRVAASVRRLYNGTIEKHKKVDTFLAKHIKFDSKTPLMLEADGEFLGQTPLEVEIVPESIKVIIGNENKFKKYLNKVIKIDL